MTKYRPANGTEGDMFRAQFCDRCWHDRDESCEIFARTLVHYVDDPEYPEEWQENRVHEDYVEEPHCTAFWAMDAVTERENREWHEQKEWWDNRQMALAGGQMDLGELLK